MTLNLPPDLEQAVADRARYRQLSVEDAVREALTRWLRDEQDMQDELDIWQEVRLDALRLVEDGPE
jgi:plasmid stability protein